MASADAGSKLEASQSASNALNEQLVTMRESVSQKSELISQLKQSEIELTNQLSKTTEEKEKLQTQGSTTPRVHIYTLGTLIFLIIIDMYRCGSSSHGTVILL